MQLKKSQDKNDGIRKGIRFLINQITDFNGSKSKVYK